MREEGYLRIGELSRRTGVSPELLRAWEQRYALLQPSRSTGRFRLYSDADVARVVATRDLIDQGVSASQAAQQALAQGPAPVTSEPLLDELTDRLSAALDSFESDEAERTFDELLARFSVESVLRDVVMPYLNSLGERWERGEVSVAQEHFASSILRGRLLGLARGWGQGRGPSAILACPPGEEHDLALIAFGIVLARRGWRITFLGPNTPFQTLADAVGSTSPDHVIMATMDPRRIHDHVADLRALVGAVPVALGGKVDPADAAAAGATLLTGDLVSAAASMR